MAETTIPAAASAASSTKRRRNFFSFRFALLYLVIASIIALAVLPPLLNVNRFKRRIVTSISTSLGRPVHLDSVTLVILPFPGFKLKNFVVAEDPPFGSEPVIHANEVQATLRLASLYRKKVEFSKISLKEPSINLVHAASGAWNVESILLKAATISAAPTAQSASGPQPRFPYIEATEARVNIKSGLEKLPFSLTETDLALWLPQPGQWRLRVYGKPSRTDTSASDTGTISLEGTLGQGEHFNLIPIDLSAEWKNVPLGEASRIFTGTDVGLRGQLRLNATLRGTVGGSSVRSSLHLQGLRRADFVPDSPINVLADCQATFAESFHALHQIRCSWPPPSQPIMLALTGDLADTHDPASANLELGTPGIPAATLLQWLRAASSRVDPSITATGILTGTVSKTSNQGPLTGLGEPLVSSAASRKSQASGEAEIAGLSGHLNLAAPALRGGPLGETPVTFGDLTVATAANGFLLSPTTIALGGRDLAALDGRADVNGYSFHLTGSVLPSRLLALGAAIPQFGDGLTQLFLPASAPQPDSQREVPIRIDITSSRRWNGDQTWSRTASVKASRSLIRTRTHKSKP